jgi:hypothetical protein
MKSFKKSILSVLVLVFAFIIMHDYVLNAIDSDTQCETAYIQGGNATVDLASNIHEHIHILLTATILQSSYSFYNLDSDNPHSSAAFINTNINSVLPRPPIS